METSERQFIKYGDDDFVYKEKPKLNPDVRVNMVSRLMKKYNLNTEEATTFLEYILDLDLSIEQLAGKRILDVGSGPGEFKIALEKIAGKSNVVNLDGGSVWRGTFDVQGMADKLPFRNESFDLVIAHCSVPIMTATTGDPLEIPQILSEIIRVVKRGGLIKIYPVIVHDRYADSKMAEKHHNLADETMKKLSEMSKNNQFSEAVINIVRDSNSGNFDGMLEIRK
ncbi:MAG: methyltransferase domain-containing protein [Candidatus Yanofskybacteria bacterium]|nr:methyltransferase domain-containing protein [Candidatus Yanofskybacteria bacterium]